MTLKVDSMGERLEIRYSKPILIIGCVVTGVSGGLTLWLGVRSNSENVGILAYSAFCWIAFLIGFTKLLDSEPKIVVDDRGITDYRKGHQLVILWEEVEEISFPYRWVGRFVRDYVLSVRFKDSQKHSQQSLIWKWTKMLPEAGDYEISPWLFFDANGLDVYNYIWLQQQMGRISVTMRPPKGIRPLTPGYRHTENVIVKREYRECSDLLATALTGQGSDFRNKTDRARSDSASIRFATAFGALLGAVLISVLWWRRRKH